MTPLHPELNIDNFDESLGKQELIMEQNKKAWNWPSDFIAVKSGYETVKWGIFKSTDSGAQVLTVPQKGVFFVVGPLGLFTVASVLIC